jgi:antitoxin ParD1/3/4
MRILKMPLSEPIMTYLDERVACGGYGSKGEYVRELIRRNRSRVHLRNLLLDGAASPATTPVDRVYFDSLRDRVRR